MDPATPAVHGPPGAVAVLVGVVALLDRRAGKGCKPLPATGPTRSRA